MAPSTTATSTAVAATLIAVAALLGTPVLAVAVALCIAIVALGWPILLRIHNPLVASAVIGGGGMLSLVAVTLGSHEPYLRYLVVSIAAVVIASFITELVWRSPEGKATYSIAAKASGGAIAAAGATWVGANRTPAAEDLVVAAAIALAIAAVASVSTPYGNVNSILAIVVAGAAGLWLSFPFDGFSWYGGAMIGVAAGTSVVITNELIRRERPQNSAYAGIAAGSFPVVIAGVMVYLAARILIG